MEIILKGEWWHPDNENDRVPGTLYIEDGKYILSLHGDVFSKAPVSTQQNHLIILGESYSNEKITLLDNIAFFKEIYIWPRVQEKYYRVRHLLKGYHFNSVEEIGIDHYMVNYTFLEEWIGRHFFELLLPLYDKEHNRIADDGIIFNLPDEHNIQIKNQDLEIYFTSIWTPMISDPRQGSIRQSCYLVFKSADRNKLEYFFRIANDFQMLLTLFMQQPIFVEKSILAIDDGDALFAKHIDMISGESLKRKKQEFKEYRDTYKYPKLKTHLEKCFNLWFEKREALYHPLKLYTAAIYVPGMNKEFELLSLVQALESYCKWHHKHMELLYMDKKKYKDWIKGAFHLLEKHLEIPEKNLRDSFVARLRQNNEKSLRDKLVEVVKLVSSYDGNLAKGMRRYPDFEKKIADTRNYFTHYRASAAKSKYILSATELPEYIEMLRSIITRLLYSELGIGAEIFSNVE